MYHDLKDLSKHSYKVQCEEHEGEEDRRRGGRITSQNGQAYLWAIPPEAQRIEIIGECWLESCVQPQWSILSTDYGIEYEYFLQFTSIFSLFAIKHCIFFFSFWRLALCWWPRGTHSHPLNSLSLSLFDNRSEGGILRFIHHQCQVIYLRCPYILFVQTSETLTHDSKVTNSIWEFTYNSLVTYAWKEEQGT